MISLHCCGRKKSHGFLIRKSKIELGARFGMVRLVIDENKLQTQVFRDHLLDN
jgi:hypothetical protein